MASNGTANGYDAQNPEVQQFIEEGKVAALHPFPIKPDELIRLAREILAVGLHKNPQYLDEERFRFQAPFVGPLTADEYKHNMELISLKEAFPDWKLRAYHFRVDPFEPGRVWYTIRPAGTHTGTFKGHLPGPLQVQPTGKKLYGPPQTASLLFNERGKVIQHTMGYVMDRLQGNTDGLGGAFGALHGIGFTLPFPEGKPWSPSIQLRLFNSGITLVQAWLLLVDRILSIFLPTWLLTKHGRNNV